MIGDYLDRWKGETAYLFGKGPSLDTFPMASAGPLRITINEAALVVPDPTFMFAIDGKPLTNIGTPPCMAILGPDEVSKRFDASGNLLHAGRTYQRGSFETYRKHTGRDILDWPKEKVAAAGELYFDGGTVQPAAHFAWMLGVIEVVLVGFDGYGPYAKILGMGDGGPSNRHLAIRTTLLAELDHLDLPYRFWWVQP